MMHGKCTEKGRFCEQTLNVDVILQFLPCFCNLMPIKTVYIIEPVFKTGYTVIQF